VNATPAIAWRLEVFETLGSTSDYCIERAKAGEGQGLAVLALQQTSGRGSRGRLWQAAPGNLSLSVLLRPELAAAQAGMFALLAGVAVADAVRDLIPAHQGPMLKWPNDILLDGAKLGGILIDATPQGEALDWLVIGIGLNLVHAPAIPGRRTATLQEHGGEASPRQAAQLVLHHLAAWLQRFETQGAGALLTAWQLRAHPLGTQLAVRTAQTSVSGRFAGLSLTGELLLNVENRIERFQTGEILLGVGG
jgi:BirA family biotin operon repressor/biotin-[acetyl-CoA-carboxylase] ligase